MIRFSPKVDHMSKSEMTLMDSVLIGPFALFFNQYFNCPIPESFVLWCCFVRNHLATVLFTRVFVFDCFYLFLSPIDSLSCWYHTLFYQRLHSASGLLEHLRLSCGQATRTSGAQTGRYEQARGFRFRFVSWQPRTWGLRLEGRHAFQVDSPLVHQGGYF